MAFPPEAFSRFILIITTQPTLNITLGTVERNVNSNKNSPKILLCVSCIPLYPKLMISDDDPKCLVTVELYSLSVCVQATLLLWVESFSKEQNCI